MSDSIRHRDQDSESEKEMLVIGWEDTDYTREKMENWTHPSEIPKFQA